MTGKDAESPQNQHYLSSHCLHFIHLQQDQNLHAGWYLESKVFVLCV